MTYGFPLLVCQTQSTMKPLHWNFEIMGFTKMTGNHILSFDNILISPFVIVPFHFFHFPLWSDSFFVFPGRVPLSVVPPPSWDPKNSAGRHKMSRITHRPGQEVASSPSSSPGSRQRGQSAACQAPRLWEGGEEAWLDSSPDDYLDHLLTLCSSQTLSMTTTSREWQGLRTTRRKEPKTVKRS